MPGDAGTGGSGGGPADAGDAGTPDGGDADGGSGTGAPDGGSDGGTADLAPPVLSPPSQSDVKRFPGPALFGASMDEGGNLWGVSADALWLWRAGAKGWERFDNHKSGGVLGNGHANDGLLSVAGGGPGEAWIGYRGLFLNGDEEDDPSIVSEAIRTSGGADRVSAAPGGIALRDHFVFWTGPGILAAEPKGRWKVRSIWTILYNHGPRGIPGDVFFGGNHGIGMFRHAIQAMDEHAHAAWNFCPASMYPECSLMTGDHKGIAIASDGNVWMGADFAAERLAYMDQPGGDLYGRVDNDDASDNVWTLAADPDGSIWVGGPQGAFRFVGRTGQWISYGGVVTGPSVNQISLDPRPGSRGVVFATDSGAFVYTGK